MIDIVSLKEHIKENEENIIAILENSDFYNITEMSYGNEIRASLHEGGSLRVRVNTETLGSVVFGTDISGDIITLVENQMSLSLRDTLKHICNILGLSKEDIEDYKPKENPFGNFFDNVTNNTLETYEDKLEILDEEMIKKRLLIMPSNLFLEDGVSYKQQKRFEIGYDYYTNRICIPYRDSMGNLVGIEGRLNKKELKDGEFKYYPIYPYPKTQVLFGYYENYSSILKKKVVMVVESAKSVMKLADMGYDFGLAVGKSHISKQQENMIRALNPKVVILAFDEDVDEARLRMMANSLKVIDPYTNFSVGYIKDKENKIMPLGSKLSPADLTKKELDKMVNDMLYLV